MLSSIQSIIGEKINCAKLRQQIVHGTDVISGQQLHVTPVRVAFVCYVANAWASIDHLQPFVNNQQQKDLIMYWVFTEPKHTTHTCIGNMRACRPNSTNKYISWCGNSSSCAQYMETSYAWLKLKKYITYI